MNEQSNGSQTPPATSLGEAIQQHAAALVKANMPNGIMSINPMQLMVDLELANLRIEVLFEAIVDMGVISPKDLVTKLTAKLLAEAEQLNAPQLAIPSGTILRNG